MHKAFFYSLLAVLVALATYGSAFPEREGEGETVTILFIGNSLISANNLPAMVAAIAGSHGHDVTYNAVTPGGARLLHHAASGEVARKLGEQSWDYVVLQEQSQYPGFAAQQLTTDVYPYAAQLVEAAREANPDTGVVFYMAMTHRDGDPANSHIAAELRTFEGAQKRVNKAYLKMAQANSTLVAPVGEAWRAVRRAHPEINLYGDNTHPNPTGTYLAACVFYATLFQSPCTGAATPEQVSQPDAETLQQTADAVVLNPGSNWDWRE
ncbi:MAG: DUF4886 domain-containing protein [Alphaproteobacteria bacterium]|nr:DUF4886 domain-containing protein [Alphaproteobacteria bacterium]